MSEWDFLWGLKGQELLDAMASGCTAEDLRYIEEQERRGEWYELKELRDSGKITREEFKKRKLDLFT